MLPRARCMLRKAYEVLEFSPWAQPQAQCESRQVVKICTKPTCKDYESLFFFCSLLESMKISVSRLAEYKLRNRSSVIPQEKKHIWEHLRQINASVFSLP